MIKLNNKTGSYFMLLVVCTTILAGCKKDPIEPEPVHETGTVTDVEGRVYKTVKIGNQWWMAEDLKVTKYRNGNPVSLIEKSLSDNVLWSKDTAGAYCVPFGSVYLYNWHVLSNDSNIIAPEGWHVPSDDEWKALEVELGMKQEEADKFNWRGGHEGEKLKIKAKSPGAWKEHENVWDTNESGFSALSTGCRMFNGVFGTPGQGSTGFWWSSSESSIQDAIYRHLDYKNTDVFRYYGSKKYGFAIRCVKD